MNIPETNTLWKHKRTGTTYELILIANKPATDREKFPIMAIYEHGLCAYARPLSEFLEKFEQVEISYLTDE